MLRCREAARLVSKSLDAPLKWKEKLPLGLHLGMCPRCSEYRRQLLALRSMLREEMDRLLRPADGAEEGLTPEEEASLIQAIAQSAQ